MTKHSHFLFTITCSSTPPNTNRKHNNHQTPTQIYNIFHHSKAKQYYFLTTNIPTDPHTVTTTAIKANMRHIYISIVSRHLATLGNDKLLRAPPAHISRYEETLPHLTRRTLAHISINKSPFVKSYLHKVDANSHPSPFLIIKHTTHIISSTAPTYAPHRHHWICGQTRWSDGTAGQMDVEAGWWTSSGKI